jgi:hypothetical protein
VPQSDGFFTLAKVNGEVTCFFLGPAQELTWEW